MKTFYFIVLNSEINKVGSVGFRAQKIISDLESQGHSILLVSRDRIIKSESSNFIHKSYFLFSYIFKLLKLIRISFYPKLSDRLFESIFLDFFSRKILNKLDLECPRKILLTFEFTPKLNQLASKKGFLIFHDIQIIPTSFALDLKKEGLIKNLKETSQLKSLIKREIESIRSATKVICPSKFVEDYLISNLGKLNSSIAVCPFGVDLKLFSFHNSEGEVNPTVNFGFLGQISERKGVKFLLDSFQDERFKDCNLFLGGELQKTNIDFSIEDYNKSNIHFLGKINQLDFFKKIDILVHPSLIEGSAKVIYEAMATGVVPIATINSGSIIEDKKNGLIVKAGDVGDLRKKMIYLLDNYPNKVLLENIKNTIRNYSWNDYSLRYTRLIEQLINQ
ncbi:MAG: hypothetical protein CL851_06830 [Crocinitomicaceae bacterium]|nr:hypothetical protein [Crocinitomicaceae bacterium]